MAFDAHVGVLLRDPELELSPEFLEHHEALIARVNAELLSRGLPPHLEPRAVAEIRPPLSSPKRAVNLGQRLGFYSADKYGRLERLALHVAVSGAAPPPDRLYEGDGISERYDQIPDRSLALDHVIAMLRMHTVLLPRPLPRVIELDPKPGAPEVSRIASAPRLREEAALLANVLRHFDETSRDYNWMIEAPSGDPAWGGRKARIEDDEALVQAWANESDLCWRLMRVADDAMRIGGVAVTC